MTLDWRDAGLKNQSANKIKCIILTSFTVFYIKIKYICLFNSSLPMSSLPIFSSIKSGEKIIVCSWMVFCFLLLTYKLGEVPPYHADENFYVESSLRMVESGDYITPVYHEKKRFAKPILYYWMVAASYKIFGVSLASARLPSVILGTLSIGLIFLLGSKLFNTRVGLFSAFILPSIYLHFQISRWATTDMALSFFILLAIYLFVLLYKTNFQRNAYAYFFYVSMGLGFMVKGPPAILIPGLTILGFFISTKRKSWFADLRLGQGLIILSIIILPWFVAMFLMHGEEFKNHIVGNEIKNRLVHSTPFSFYYVGVLFRYQLPWALFFLFAVLKQFGFLTFAGKKGIVLTERVKELGRNVGKNIKLLFKEENEPVAFCYLWILVCLVLFTLLRIEHSRYMLPGCPAVAILTARMFAEVEKDSWKVNIFGFKFSILFTLSILLVFSILTGAGVFLLNSIPTELYFLPLFLLLGGVSLVWYNWYKSAQKIAFSLALVLVLVFSSLSGDVLPFVNRYPMKKFADQINRENFKGPIAVFHLGSHRARLGILTGRTVVTVSSPVQIEKLLKTNHKFYLVIKESDWEKYFLESGLEIIHKDQISKKVNLKENEISGLSSLEKIRKKLDSTETVYFMSNK